MVTYQRATAPRDSVRLAMLPFESGTGAEPVIEDLLRDTSAQLARIQSNARMKFTLAPLRDVLRHKADTIEKARAPLGATHVLRGTLTKEKGDSFFTPI